MPEAATETKPVSTVESQMRNTEITKEEFLAPVENPASVKDHLVNNIYKAAEKVDKSVYNGTNGQKDDLVSALRFQAFLCKTNDKEAFFTEKFSEALEINLRNKDSASLKTNREGILQNFLPEAEAYPSDPKVAAEYVAIITASLDDSIRTVAVRVGAITQQPAKPTDVPIADNGIDKAVKVSVPQQ